MTEFTELKKAEGLALRKLESAFIVAGVVMGSEAQIEIYRLLNEYCQAYAAFDCSFKKKETK